jgi:predicted PhzF superfamily epimerase YddE/YHI9
MTAPTSLPLVLIEAFAAAPHQGNGATVVALEAPVTAEWMQAVAGTLRQSETAFVLPWGDAWAIRWFTPSCEVKLCGHATLAATLALGHWGSLQAGETTVFHSRSGPLAVSLPSSGETPTSAAAMSTASSTASSTAMGTASRTATIELPSSELVAASVPAGLEDLLTQRLGCGVEQFWNSALGYSVGLLPSGADCSALDGLADQLPPPCRPGLVLMQALRPSDDDFRPVPRLEGLPADYQLRFFAPGLGISEDPVTGSAHALVAPFWQQRLGRDSVRGWQCSPQGGGMVCERTAGGAIRLRGPGQLLVDGRLSWDGLACDPQDWALLVSNEVSA